jgi:hypothetical protein
VSPLVWQRVCTVQYSSEDSECSLIGCLPCACACVSVCIADACGCTCTCTYMTVCVFMCVCMCRYLQFWHCVVRDDLQVRTFLGVPAPPGQRLLRAGLCRAAGSSAARLSRVIGGSGITVLSNRAEQ